jgi:hypothetical protein
MRRNTGNHPDKVNADERKRQAIAMRRTGATFEDIGRALGISTQAAHKAVKRALAELAAMTMDEAASLRALELDRLDRMQAAIWRNVTSGNLSAVDRALRIMERRAKLLGLDAPAKVASTNPEGDEERPFGFLVLPEEIEDVDEWVRRNAPTTAPTSH